MKTLSDLLNHCQEQKFTMIAFYEVPSDPDYKGENIRDAKEALEACDEMNLKVVTPEGQTWGTCFIVNEAGQDPEEQIADYRTGTPMAAWFEGEAA